MKSYRGMLEIKERANCLCLFRSPSFKDSQHFIKDPNPLHYELFHSTLNTYFPSCESSTPRLEVKCLVKHVNDVQAPFCN